MNAYEGSRRYLEAAREAGLRCAVVSASANTGPILERAGLAGLVEQRIDGNTIVAAGLRAWPAPDVLLAACRQLDVRPQQTAVFETDVAGSRPGMPATSSWWSASIAVATPKRYGVRVRTASSAISPSCSIRRLAA